MMEVRKTVKQKFNDVAMEYDQQRKALIPCFDDFYGIATEMIKAEDKPLSILDIGSGTGLFSSFVIQKYPNATFTLIDISEQMIEEAKKRFQHYSNITYMVGDYTTCTFSNSYDVIISSLSIHHLSHAEKQVLFQTIYNILNKGGIFINADQVSGNTVSIDKLYKEAWESKIHNSYLSEEAILAAKDRRKLDNNAPLPSQLQWLQEAGFSDVDCIYKYYEFAVMFGRKS